MFEEIFLSYFDFLGGEYLKKTYLVTLFTYRQKISEVSMMFICGLLTIHHWCRQVGKQLEKGGNPPFLFNPGRRRKVLQVL